MSTAGISAGAKHPLQRAPKAPAHPRAACAAAAAPAIRGHGGVPAWLGQEWRGEGSAPPGTSLLSSAHRSPAAHS